MSAQVATLASSARTPSVRAMMGWTLIALVPGTLAQTLFDDSGLPMRIALAALFALLFEAVMLRWRSQPLRPFLTDLSAPVTAVLFALWLPPATPWWIALLGMAAAIGLAKHAFGGLGHNLLNPAMAGVASLFLLLPQHFSTPAARGGEIWIALAYACGGLTLLALRIVRWQVPVAMLGTAVLLSIALSLRDGDPATALESVAASAPWLVAAFFLATDPVTSCSSPRGRWIFGAGVAAFAIGLQARGAPPQAALALALLLMNAAAPWIDRRSEPHVWTQNA